MTVERNVQKKNISKRVIGGRGKRGGRGLWFKGVVGVAMEHNVVAKVRALQEEHDDRGPVKGE